MERSMYAQTRRIERRSCCAVLAIVLIISAAGNVLVCNGQSSEGRADLELRCQGITVLPYGEILLEVIVLNVGDVVSLESVVEAAIGEPPLSRRSQEVPPLPSGGSVVLRFTFQIQPDSSPIEDSLRIAASVDPGNLLLEADELNNSWAGTVVNPPDAEPLLPAEEHQTALRTAAVSLGTDVIDEAMRAFPQAMVLLVPEKVEITVTRESIEGIIEKWRKDLPQLSEDEYVSTAIEAELTSSTGFRVVSHGEGTQSILTSHPGEVAFTITPLPAVRRILYLGIDVILEAGTKRCRLQFLRPCSAIAVRANVGIMISYFLRENWKWIVGTLLIGSGLVGVTIRRIRKAIRRKARAEETDVPRV